jgi:hypothetical protein
VLFCYTISFISWPCHFLGGCSYGHKQGRVSPILANSFICKRTKRILGLAGYYRKFIHNFGAIAAPLIHLLKKQAFHWTDEATTAFLNLKQALTSAPVLQLPYFQKTFTVDCDASGSGFGAVLHQGTGPIAFFSKQFATRDLKVAAYERELIGLVQAVRH